MPRKLELNVSSKKYKGETSVISARIPVDLVKRIDAIAEKTGRTRNEIILMCLEFSVENIVVSDGNERD